MYTLILFLTFTTAGLFSLFLYYFLRERALNKRYGSIIDIDAELKKRERLIKDLESRYMTLLMRTSRKQEAAYDGYQNQPLHYSGIGSRAIVTKDALR